MLASQVGAPNVFTDLKEDWSAVGWESVVDRDPQVLVLGDLLRDRFPGATRKPGDTAATMVGELLSAAGTPEVNDTTTYKNKVKVVPAYLHKSVVITKDNLMKRSSNPATTPGKKSRTASSPAVSVAGVASRRPRPRAGGWGSTVRSRAGSSSSRGGPPLTCP